MNGNVIASLVCMSETAKFFYINFKILVAFPRVGLWKNIWKSTSGQNMKPMPIKKGLTAGNCSFNKLCN